MGKNSRDAKVKLLRCFQFGLMLALTMTAFYYRKQITVEAILSYVPKSYFFAFWVFMLLYLLKSVTVVIPLVVFYVASGIVFDGSLAVLVNICGVAVCTCTPFFTGRLTGKELHAAAEEKIPSSVSQFLAQHSVSDFRKSLLLRVIGIVPCDIISYYLGSSSTAFLPYFLGSVIGFLPDLIPQTLIGVAASDPSSPLFIVSVSISLLLKASAFVLSKVFSKQDY